MNAAIYARKSTDQSDRADDAKSVTRQIENAHAFAREKGWKVSPAHVYSDDGVSGAAVSKLRNRQRLLDLIRSGQAPFQVLILRDRSRFSRRDGDESFTELKQIAQAGVQVWFYLDRTRFEYGSLASNVLGFLQGEFAAEFRRAVTAATVESHDELARNGYVTGGRVFGYDNVGEKRRRERQINQREAAVVTEIFERYARGEGFKTIAHALNDRGLPTPRAQKGRPSGWDPGTIRAVLDRDLYRGLMVYKKTKKRDEVGEQRQRPRPETEWIRVPKPHLRFMPEELIAQVDARRAHRRAQYANAVRSGPVGTASHGKYLLSGLLRCPCGANFEAQTPKHGRRTGVYVCSAHRRKGRSICGNTLMLPIEATDQAILEVVEGSVLHPDFIERLVDSIVSPADTDRASLETEQVQLQAEVENLTVAIKAGGDIPVLVAELKKAHARLAAIRGRLRPSEPVDRANLREALTLRAAGWRETMRSNPKQGRQVLEELIGPIELWMDGPIPAWIAQTKPEGLLRGVVQGLASPPGFVALWHMELAGLMAR